MQRQGRTRGHCNVHQAIDHSKVGRLLCHTNPSGRKAAPPEQQDIAGLFLAIGRLSSLPFAIPSGFCGLSFHFGLQSHCIPARQMQAAVIPALSSAA